MTAITGRIDSTDEPFLVTNNNAGTGSVGKHGLKINLAGLEEENGTCLKTPIGRRTRSNKKHSDFPSRHRCNVRFKMERECEAGRAGFVFGMREQESSMDQSTNLTKQRGQRFKDVACAWTSGLCRSSLFVALKAGFRSGITMEAEPDAGLALRAAIMIC